MTIYPRARLDALSDAVFGVAMTLLVLDVRLPEEFQPRDAQDLLQALHGLAPKFLPYVLSFWVLGLRWLSNIQVRSHGEVVGREYARWWLLYLLLITCVPFTTIIVGRFGNLAPAIWVYAGNTILISAVAFRLMALTPDIEPGDHLHERRVSLVLLMVSSTLAIAWSFVDARQALWALMLNLATPAIARWGLKSS
jgi:uncharacterized membrane protein